MTSDCNALMEKRMAKGEGGDEKLALFRQQVFIFGKEFEDILLFISLLFSSF